jgi:hypothetical protein
MKREWNKRAGRAQQFPGRTPMAATGKWRNIVLWLSGRWAVFRLAPHQGARFEASCQPMALFLGNTSTYVAVQRIDDLRWLPCSQSRQLRSWARLSVTVTLATVSSTRMWFLGWFGVRGDWTSGFCWFRPGLNNYMRYCSFSKISTFGYTTNWSDLNACSVRWVLNLIISFNL